MTEYAPPPLDREALPEIVLRPPKGWLGLQLRELWAYRELFFFLTWRDVKVRYKQTVLGAAWAILQPITSMIVFTIFFNRLAGIAPGGDLPYSVWNYTAMVPWAFFSEGMRNASNSLVGSANLLKKVYFPRLVIPASTVVSGLVDFVLAFGVLLVMMLVYGITPTLNIVFLPFFLLLALAAALGVGLWLSAMNVMFRDVRYMVPFMTQLWMFVTPIVYPSTLIADEKLRMIYGINPMAGVVEGFRWALLGMDTAPGPMLIVSVVMTVLLLVSGAFYFRRVEKTFADVV